MHSGIKKDAPAASLQANLQLVNMVNRINKAIRDPKFIDKHRVGDKDFSRNRFFTFDVLTTFLLYNLQKSIQRELSIFKDCAQLHGGSIAEPDKSTFCKARKKLQPSAFKSINDIIIKEAYSAAGNYSTWRGVRLLAVDGSTIEVPNSKESVARYGAFSQRKDGKSIVMARTLMVYDSISHLVLDGKLDTMNASETSMLWECLPNLKLDKNDLFLFDRYYACQLLFFYLKHRGAQFCFRMRTGNCWKMIEAFYKGTDTSTIITIKLPKRHRERAKELGIENTMMECRLTKVVLKNGTIEVLLSSLTDERVYSVADTGEIYNLRWQVEEGFKTFKQKLCLENFSGKSEHTLQQDFYSKMVIMNLIAVSIKPINEKLKDGYLELKKQLEAEAAKQINKPQKKKTTKRYCHQVNIIEATATLKNAVVSFFMFKQINKAISRITERLIKSTEPIRPGRNFNRPEIYRRKFYMTCKPV